MILLIHIVVALASMLVAAMVFIAPAARMLVVSYVLIAATLTSGIYLIAANPAHMMQACIVGVLYLTVDSGLTVVARRRLAAGAEE